VFTASATHAMASRRVWTVAGPMFKTPACAASRMRGRLARDLRCPAPVELQKRDGWQSAPADNPPGFLIRPGLPLPAEWGSTRPA
jgi:hypothetical protein